ncbi:MAG: DNA repair protein RadA [Clostridia bacterium]|nr:DNA repair protein RadA [Clostridia bacterium]
MKQKSVFICSECGNQSPKWMGKCTMCGSWNTMEEEIILPSSSPVASFSPPSSPKKIAEIDSSAEVRQGTGMSELDRVLGGGLVKGSFVLVGGDPGIGKSTLLLQICEFLGQTSKILYVSGEESPNQIKLRGERLGITTDNLKVYSETNMNYIKNAIAEENPDIIIVDSVQTMLNPEIGSSPGNVSQIKDVTSSFMRIAKDNNITVFLVGHVTKDGAIAGPKILEHMVDTVLYFEGDNQQSYRILRAVKNRFGSTNEIGVFEMEAGGLSQVANPSEALLSGRPEDSIGSCICCSMEGTRPVLAEIQALISPTSFGNPRRMTQGPDLNRVLMLLAVMEKQSGLHINSYDAYVNIVGGFKISETATDLGIVLALASSFRNRSLDKGIVAIGEVGLTGETRSVSFLEGRIQEAEKMGFTTCLIPYINSKKLRKFENIEVIPVKHIKDAINKFL